MQLAYPNAERIGVNYCNLVLRVNGYLTHEHSSNQIIFDCLSITGNINREIKEAIKIKRYLSIKFSIK